MNLSVIIVNYNAGPFLRPCLASAENHLKGVDCEICVIDNASSDGSAAWIPIVFPNVKLIANSENLGFARAMNQGIRATSGKYILWLNPDTEFQDGKMKDLLDYMDRESGVGILGAQITNPDGSVQLSSRAFPSYEHYFFGRYSLLTRLFPNNPISQKFLQSGWDHSEIREVDWVSGACLLHRRQLVEEIGPLDEGYFMYFEDVDFCRQAKEKGWKVVYHPGSCVLHHIAGSTSRVARRMLIERHKSNWRYYTKYFKRNPAKDVFIAAGLAARCAVQMMFPPERHGVRS